MTYGLKENIIRQIQEVFASYPEVQQVLLYGSRAKGNHRDNSDIDLVLAGKKLNTQILNKISWALDDLLLPYTFDLSIFYHIKNPHLLDHIQRAGKVFYERDKVAHTLV